MKKRFLFLCCLCLAVALVGCQKDDSPDIDNESIEVRSTAEDSIDVDSQGTVRKAAWDLIDAETRETVTHSWEDARVAVGEFEFWVFLDENPRYEKRYCYRVVFSTTHNDLTGPICMYLDISTLEHLGIDLYL